MENKNNDKLKGGFQMLSNDAPGRCARFWTTFLATILLCGGMSLQARATALLNNSSGGDFLQYYSVSPNDLDFSSGSFIRYGADSITPNGVPSPTQTIPGAVSGDTTGTASTTNTSNGTLIPRTLSPLSSPETPNFFSGLLTLCTTNCSPTGNNNPANLQGPWTITFSNSTTTPTSISQTLSLSGSGVIPFVNSVTLSGTTAQPTFSWTPPAGTSVDGYRVNIYQNNLETFNSGGGVVDTGQVSSVNLPPGTTSYTVQPSDFTIPGFGLQTNTQYTIAIIALETRNGSTTNLNNSNVSALSFAYSNFTIPSSGTIPTVNLPTTTVSGSQVTFGFNLTVAPGVTYYLDPEVATGYVFQTGAGNPNFATVLLPDLQGSDPYTITWDGGADSEQVLGGDLFSFLVTDLSGVDSFTVTGIDPSLGLDPLDTTAFVAGVTFVGGGNFTGTMTPITTDVASVPEPTSLAIFGSGLLCFWVGRRRRNKH